GHPMPPALPDAIILGLAAFAPLFSERVWCHAQVLFLGAILAPRARTVTSALRVMGFATERHFTNYHAKTALSWRLSGICTFRARATYLSVPTYPSILTWSAPALRLKLLTLNVKLGPTTNPGLN